MMGLIFQVIKGLSYLREKHKIMHRGRYFSFSTIISFVDTHQILLSIQQSNYLLSVMKV